MVCCGQKLVYAFVDCFIVPMSRECYYQVESKVTVLLLGHMLTCTSDHVFYDTLAWLLDSVVVCTGDPWPVGRWHHRSQIRIIIENIDHVIFDLPMYDLSFSRGFSFRYPYKKSIVHPITLVLRAGFEPTILSLVCKNTCIVIRHAIRWSNAEW